MRAPARRTPNVFRRTAVTLAAALLMPVVALAHGALRSSTPASGVRLTTAPREIKLVFTEKPEIAVTRVQLFGPDSAAVELGPLTVAPDAARGVVAVIRGALSAGTYTVAWQTAGADGHPVRGRFTFTIAAGATGLAAPPTTTTAAVDPGARPAGEPGAAVPAPGQPAPPATHHDASSMPEGGGFDAGSPGYVAIRWAQYTALLVVLGAFAFNFFVLGFMARREGADNALLSAARDRAAGFALWGAVALGATALVRLYAQSYAMHGGQEALSGGLVSTMLTRTTWGWGWLLQIVGAVVAVAAFAAARRGSRAGWTVAALAAVALAFSPALSGHAAAAPRLTGLAILADGLHVIGAGGWLGSLLFVLAVGVPVAVRQPVEPDRWPAVASFVNAFSPTALVFAGLAGATGVFAAWLHMGSVPALWQTDYGRTLLLKLGILSVVAGTGAYNWLRVKPALGDEAGARRLRKSATVELAVGVLVLVVTAVLVATPPPMDASMMEPDENAAAPAGTSAPSAMGDAGSVAAPQAPRDEQPARTADQRFLREMADHHEGVIRLAHEVMQRTDTGAVKGDATALDAAQDSEKREMLALLDTLYRDSHDARPTAADGAAADSVLRLAGASREQAFREFVVRHHRRGVQMIDGALASLANERVRELARRMRGTQQQEITAYEQKLAAR